MEKHKSEITKLRSKNEEMENKIQTMEDKINQNKKKSYKLELQNNKNNIFNNIQGGTVRHTTVTKMEKIRHGFGHYSSYIFYPIYVMPSTIQNTYHCKEYFKESQYVLLVLATSTSIPMWPNLALC